MPETNEPKTAAQEIYQAIYKEQKINPRTVQWYATEGYIPKPEKVGSEAYYSPAAQIQVRIRIIQLLQKKYDCKLKEIKDIVGKHNDEDWESILNLLTALEEHFPMVEYNDHGDERYSEKGHAMGRIIVEMLKIRPFSKVSLADAEEIYDAASKESPFA